MTHRTDERCPHLSCLVYHSNGVCMCDMRKSCSECRSKSVNVPPPAKTPFFNEKNLDFTPHTPSSDWEESLYIEVMEDYVVTAELGHLAKDQKKHKEEMRAHFANLKSFIRTHIENARRETLNKAIKSISSLKTEGRPNPYSDERYRNDALDEAIQSLQATLNKES